MSEKLADVSRHRRVCLISRGSSPGLRRQLQGEGPLNLPAPPSVAGHCLPQGHKMAAASPGTVSVFRQEGGQSAEDFLLGTL